MVKRTFYIFSYLEVDAFNRKAWDNWSAAKLCKLGLVMSGVSGAVLILEAVMTGKSDSRVIGKYCVAEGPY